MSENVDIDIDIVSCNPLIFLWNNLEFYMCGANFYCCSCVLAFFFVFMLGCNFVAISHLLCVDQLSLLSSHSLALDFICHISWSNKPFPEGHRRHPGHCLLLSQSEQRVVSYEVDIYIISKINYVNKRQGAVHILRQPCEGGMTNADHC